MSESLKDHGRDRCRCQECWDSLWERLDHGLPTEVEDLRQCGDEEKGNALIAGRNRLSKMMVYLYACGYSARQLDDYVDSLYRNSHYKGSRLASDILQEESFEYCTYDEDEISTKTVEHRCDGEQ